MDDNDQKRYDILNDIDSVTHPDKMTPTEAVEFLEELFTDLDGRIDALREENELD